MNQPTGVAAVFAVLAASFVMFGCGGSAERADTPSSSSPPATVAVPSTSRTGDEDCGPGRMLSAGECVRILASPTTTTTTVPRPTTTIVLPGAVLSGEAKQAVIDCAAGQAYHAALIVNGSQASRFMKDMRGRLCELAVDRLESESRTSSGPVRELVVKLTGNSADLAFWELSVALGTDVRPGPITGLVPNQAIGWEEEIRGIVATIPTGG